MKKILYITTVSSTINAFLVPHIKDLIKNGNTVDCAASSNRELDKSLVDLGVRFFNITFSRNPINLKNIIAFKDLIKIQNDMEYDIIHVHTPIAAFYGRLLKLKFPNLKTIYTAHGFHFYKGAPKRNWIVYYFIEKLMAKFTDTIITMNEEDYNFALKFNIKNTYKVRGVGIDLRHFSQKQFSRNDIRYKLGLKDDDFVVLMIAEVNKNKNHIQMIETVEELKKRGKEIKVICAGKGPLLKNIQSEIKTRNLEANIRMLGFRNDIPELISACDIGILLSYREGLPRNVMELMAYGKPVIGTNIRGIRDLIIDDKTGYLVELQDCNSTANAIEKIMQNDNLNKFKEKSLREVLKYDVVEILKELNYIYKSTIE